MADSSPSLQNNAPNFLAELSHDTPEASTAPHIAAQRETTARLASEYFTSGGEHFGGSDGLKRAASVLAGGLADGVVDSAKNSLNLHTMETVAESVGIGYGLGALTKAGPIGQRLALAGGLVMGAKWIYDEVERGRPQATMGAVADAYRSGENAAQDRQIVAANGGALAFETGLAFAAGGLGMKKGLELNSNWHVDAIAGVKSTYGSAVDFIARDGRLNGAHVLREGDPGMAFAGKDTGAATGVMGLAKDIISGKSKGSGSLTDIQETFNRSHAQRNDAQLLDGRSKLVDLEAQHAQIKTEETALGPKLTKLVKDKAELDSFTTLEQTVRVRQQSLTDAQQAGREIPAKQRALNDLFTEKQLAFEKQKPQNGTPAEQGLRDDFQAKHRNFLEEKAKLDDLKTNGSQESIQRHRESLAEAQAALQEARTSQPAKMAEAQREIDALNDQLTGLKTRRLAIEAEVKPIVEAYNNRLATVVKDPSQLVQAQFEPPVAKAAKPAASKATALVDLEHVAATPVDMKAVTEAAADLKHTTGDATLATAPAHPETALTPGHGTETVHAAEAGQVTDASLSAIVQTKGAAAGERQLTAHTDTQPAAVEVKPAALEAAPPKDQPIASTTTEGLQRKVGDSKSGTAADAAESAGVGRLSSEARINRETAINAVRSNELLRDKEYATKVLGEIAQGTYRPTNRASVADVKIEMERRLADANEKLNGDPGVKFTRALKSVLQYTRSVSKQLAETPDAAVRDGITTQGLTDIEGMMGRLPSSYKGFQDKLPDLAEPSRLGRNGSPEKRFADVSEHLEGKVANLDGSRARQVADRASVQPTLREIMRRLSASELPADGSVILLDHEGKYLGPQGGTSPFFIEVARMHEKGVGADGGGFNRFEKIHDDIAGAVVLRPIYENGKPVELPNRSSGGKPVYKKIVAETFGQVPEEIKPNLNFVDILRRFAPARPKP